MPLQPFTPVRRIITGHDAAGTALFDDDRALPAFSWGATAATDKADDNKAHDDIGLVDIFRTDAFPAAVQGPWPETNRKPRPLTDRVGTTLRAVDFPAGAAVPMHRTVSLDFGVVLKGEVVCALDGGVEKVCGEGDVVVQRGTIHAWYNRTKEPARMLFVMMPAEKVKVDGKELGDVAPGEAPEN